jgi:hypothetical protein
VLEDLVELFTANGGAEKVNKPKSVPLADG